MRIPSWCSWRNSLILFEMCLICALDYRMDSTQIYRFQGNPDFYIDIDFFFGGGGGWIRDYPCSLASDYEKQTQGFMFINKSTIWEWLQIS